MPSPTGWREVPCAECGAFVAGIDFGERCRPCARRRARRVHRLTRRIALAGAALAALSILRHPPTGPSAVWYVAAAVAVTYALVYLIAQRILQEVLS